MPTTIDEVKESYIEKLKHLREEVQIKISSKKSKKAEEAKMENAEVEGNAQNMIFFENTY